MPFPKLSNGRVDPQLTEILLAYTNPAYLADQILPVVPNLKEEKGHIPQMGNAHLRSYFSKRSLWDNGQHRISFSISNDGTYQIDYFDLSSYVPDRLQDQLQAPFDARNAAQMTVLEALKLEREVALAAQLTSTAVLTNNTTLSGTQQYTDQANSTPEVDFDTARDSVQSKTGREANAMLMSRKVANALRRHPFFLNIAIAKLTGGAQASAVLSTDALVQTLKAWYGLDYVFIGSGIKITSQQGQTETKGPIWGNDVVFFYRPSAPSLFTPSFGYSFQLQGQNLRTVIRRDVEDKGDVVEVNWAYTDAILDVNAAYLIKDATA